jgi:hypothetical protein
MDIAQKRDVLGKTAGVQKGLSEETLQIYPYHNN